MLTSIVMALGFVSLPAQAGKIKCWKNSDGIRECGNSVPPEYAQKGHDELNDQGIKLKSIEPALSKEEIAERNRIETDKKAKQQAIDAKKLQDRVLLSTFANEDEVIMARNGKVIALRTEIKLTQKSLNKAKNHLIKSRKSAANYERAGKRIPLKITNDVTVGQQKIENYEQFITNKENELKAINTQFDSDLKRYRVLRKSRYPIATPK